MPAELSRNLNALGLLAVSALLAVAFYYQLRGELPCPLCILQRLGFAVAGFGLALNVMFRPRPQHYGLTLLGAVAGAAVSTRQVFLHIAPGTGSYGSAFFGIHFYTWAFVGFVAMIVGTALMLLWGRQFEADGPRRPVSGLGVAALACFAALVLLNGLSTFAECAGGLCPDDPTGYELFAPRR